MATVLSWMIEIAWKVGILSVIWMLVRTFMKNGKGTLKELLETSALALRYGCLKARTKISEKLKERKEKEEDDEPDDDKECKVWGTVR